MPLQLNITNETSQLDSVILGTSIDPGAPGSLNPKARFHLEHGSYPTQDEIYREVEAFEKILLENGVKVFRPVNIQKMIQLFTRDIGFVIGDRFFISAMSQEREKELEGINYLLELMDPSKITDLRKEKELSIEGGDVIVTPSTIFVGKSERTNDKGYEFLKTFYKGQKNVVQVKLSTDKNDHREHPVHLDCVFQPVGQNFAIVYDKAIKNSDTLYKYLDIPLSNIFRPNEIEFVQMVPNILSLNENTVIIEKEFIELKYWLLERGFRVIETPFKNVSKLSGLLRCVTLPLCRK